MKKFFSLALGAFALLAILVVSFYFISQTYAEQSGSSPESGATSRLKATYDSLVSLSYGSESAGSWGDWGTMWNRIRSAAEFTPSGDAAVGDTRTGKTFYSSSRTQQTGTLSGAAVAACSTQQYHDSHASATQANNCVDNITWSDPADGITGTDKRDQNTTLIWSYPLYNNAGTVEFSSSTNSTWSWDASGANNVAVGGKTASELCSERGNSWRLPTQKELQQAYIDGSYWNLNQPSNTFWSVTEYDATNAWRVTLYSGYTSNSAKTTTYQVRCVR